MRADDEKATSPGDVLRELFNAYGPCLILIDEWVAYARQLHDQSDLPAGTFETQFTFAQTLTEAAKAAQHCLLVISLPASDTAEHRELGLLHDHLAAAVAGQGQVVGLVGEPGMGKTRLLTEFCRRLAGQPVTVYVGQCLSYGQATPYLPVRDILRQVCGCVEGDETSRHTVAVQHRLHASGMTAEEDVALLCQLLDLSVAPEGLTPWKAKGSENGSMRHAHVW